MASLAIHPKTSGSLKAFTAAPSQVLAIIGPEGSGKLVIASQIISQLLQTDQAKALDHPNLHHITRPDGKQDIPIDSIRALIAALRVKVPGSGQIKRVVLIENAHQMNQESQNALLKTLEQPNPDTVFLLTLINTTKVLPTILSRAQKLIVYPVDQATAIDNYQNDFDKARIALAWNLSEGAPKLLDELLKSESHSGSASIAQAKEFLAKDQYHRLLGLNDLAKDRQQLALFLDALAKILKALHHSNIRKKNEALANRLLVARKLTQYSQQALQANTSAKLIALNLIVNFNL